MRWLTLLRGVVAPCASLVLIAGFWNGVAAQSGIGCNDPDASAVSMDSSRLRGESRLVTLDSTPAAWFDLACSRAVLYRAGAIARPGPEQPLGASWYDGALRAAVRALELDSTHVGAANLLGALILAENHPAPRDRILAALRAAAAAGVQGRDFLRGCARFTREHLPVAEAGTCSDRALLEGSDSTFHLIELARLHAAVPDTATTATAFDYAVEAARDSLDWALIEWHLTWFLEPAEVAAWERLPRDERAAWIRDRLATRDARDGNPRGTRILVHLRRLAVADSQFRRLVPRRDWERFAHAAAPESDLDSGWLVKYWEPGLAAAEPFRLHAPRHPGYDDRAAVWMRFGPPDDRITWSAADRAPLPGDPELSTEDRERLLLRPGTSRASNTREVWRYRLDGQPLVLHFEAEQFDGSSEATRLVAGVLGHYLCDVDAVRCALTQQAAAPGTILLVTPEKVAALREADREAAAEATTRDDTAVRTEHAILVVAQLHRLRDPGTGEPLVIVPHALRTSDLSRRGDSARVLLTLRAWDGAAEAWREVRLDRSMRLGRVGARDYVTGLLELRGMPTVSSWSLVAEQGASHRGRATGSGAAGSSAGDVYLSDLVLGSDRQGEAWRTPSGEAVPLAPLGAFARSAPITMYWQLDHAGESFEASVTIALYRSAAVGDTKALEITERMTFTPRLHEVMRDLDVSQLEGGRYRLELVVRSATGETWRRTAQLLLD